ncbi:phosphatidylinositol-binding protein scs2, partial [Linderina macrospora]
QEFPADHKCRDKFLIQSIQITPEMDSMPMSELWAIVEREAKGSINEKKLRVKYLAPPTTEPSTASEGNTMPERPASPSKPQPSPARASPATTRQLPGPSPLAKSIDHLESAGEESPEPSSPVTTLATSIGAAERSVDNTLVNKPRLFEETPASSPADTTTYAHEIDDAPKQVPVVAAAAAAAARASPAKNDLAVALETANATIASLQTQLGDVKRQLAASEQIAASSSSSSQKQQSRVAVKQQQTVDGFSSQSVVAVALAAFLVGYFFF